MSALLERSFKVLEHLADHPEGQPLSSLAKTLEIPLSATHRLLAELVRCGYVRQDPRDGHYLLTIKLVSVGLSFLSRSGVVDIAQPLLDQLAARAGELVRLAVVDGDDLTFVAKAQGATRGLRYDPDMGLSVPLSCSAAGHAWLSTLDEDAAVALVTRQGLGKPEDYGPRAPTTLKAVLTYVRAARRRGFSMINEVFAPAMTAMAAPVRGAERRRHRRHHHRRAAGAPERGAHGRTGPGADGNGRRGGARERGFGAVQAPRLKPGAARGFKPNRAVAPVPSAYCAINSVANAGVPFTRAAAQRHVAHDFRRQDADRMPHAGLARHRAGVVEGPPDEHELRAQRQRQQHVVAAAKAAVDHHRIVAAQRLDHARQHLHRRDRAVELATTVVRQDDAVGALLARLHGVALVEDALDHQLALPAPADQHEVLPVQVVARAEIAQHARTTGSARRAWPASSRNAACRARAACAARSRTASRGCVRPSHASRRLGRSGVEKPARMSPIAGKGTCRRPRAGWWTCYGQGASACSAPERDRAAAPIPPTYQAINSIAHRHGGSRPASHPRRAWPPARGGAAQRRSRDMFRR